MATAALGVAVDGIETAPFTVPTERPESDGTLEWDQTTIIIVEARTGGVCWLGYTYADTATAQFIKDPLVDVVQGRDVMAVSGAWTAMLRAVRNLGRMGVAAMAIAAVDSAPWDLKARLLDVPLATLPGIMWFPAEPTSHHRLEPSGNILLDGLQLGVTIVKFGFDRSQPSPFWFRGGGLLLMCLPCIIWLWWAWPHLRHRSLVANVG